MESDWLIDLNIVLAFLGGMFLMLICAYLFIRNQFVSTSKVEANFISRTRISTEYVARDTYDAVLGHQEIQKYDLHEKEKITQDLVSKLAREQEKNKHLEQELSYKVAELTELHQKMEQQFERIANKILEDKTERFTIQNQQSLERILKPVETRIQQFSEQVDRKFQEDAKDKVSLKTEIQQLRSLNNQLSKDAADLTNALKGDNKFQGDWGEYSLDIYLETAGLKEGVHYTKQGAYYDPFGKNKRPDITVHLPENKHIILDSKLSLVAYDKYLKAENDIEQKKYLNELVKSVREHYRNLHSKNYHQLNGINSPDFVLMYMPIEPVLHLVLNHEPSIYNDALEKGVILVANTTLLVTLKTIAFIWKQNAQKENVQEIARQSGLLYDKLVSFVSDLQQVGQRLSQASDAYNAAFNKLNQGARKGDTLIGRAEKIKKLGANTTKQLPPNLLS